MNDKEINQRVATYVMGWLPVHYEEARKRNFVAPPNSFLLDVDGECYQMYGGEYPLCGLFQPATDIAAAFRMEEAIKASRLGVAYASALLRAVILPYHESETVLLRMGALLDMVHASPRSRCLAALEIFVPKTIPTGEVR